MNYLYGDSTTSTLKSNFLEFLRDAIDFAVFVLQADARMKEGRVQIRVLGAESDAESGRLERFITSVSRAVHNGEKGEPDSPTAQCGARLASLIVDAHRASIDGIRHNLSEAIARIEADEAAGRDACVKALGELLAPHEPPDASTVLRLGLLDSGRYDATLEGKAEPALAWTLEVGVADGHPWSSPMRVERLLPHLEIRAPQLAGWISKEVKVRPLRIERYVVTQLVDDNTTVRVELRTEPTSGIGVDFEVDPDRGAVTKAQRVGPADDQSVGPFDLQVEDVPLVVELVQKLRESLGGLERRPNIAATFDNTEFRALPTFVDFVVRLVAMMAPICQEISARSLTPNELVLRRLLSNDRREEIFVAKATLREKLAVLPAESRALFDSLGLDVVDKAKPSAPPSDRPPVRSELPPSAPPPPVPKSAPPPAPKAPPPPAPKAPAAKAPKSTPPPPPSIDGRTIKPPTAVPPPKNPPASTPPPPKRMVSDAPQIEVVEEVEMSSDALLEAIPESTKSLVTKTEGQPRNEALVAALKKIMMLSKNGRAVEAYQEYENLFSSEAFGDYRPDEQRQALKLMVLAKTHPADKAAVTSAHKAALTRIKALVEAAREPEPADQELLGVTYVFLGDEKAAGAAFQVGLDVERAKNPQSDLIATLMRRVSQL
ncbi:MAG: hypothetical protein KF764_00530 [Labilithrix sp.]|nr:hypothetical protein [Labilithrix sp.]